MKRSAEPIAVRRNGHHIPVMTKGNFMRKRVAAVLIAPLLLALGACAAPRFGAEVTQFHTLGPSPAPQSFVLVASDQAKGDTLEFAAYASQVVNGLQARGFRQVDSARQSELVARLNYQVGPGMTESFARPVYGYYPDVYSTVRGRTSEGKPFSARVYESGGYVPLGYAEESRIVYQRTLTLDMLDAAAWRRGQTRKVYEGRVVSIGPAPELARVVPLMVRALFVDFPGPSGATRTIVLPDEDLY